MIYSLIWRLYNTSFIFLHHHDVRGLVEGRCNVTFCSSLMHAQGDKKEKYANHKIETILQQVSINSSKSNVKQNSDNDSPHDVLVYPSVIYQIKILFHRINQPIQLNKKR